jgi:hypothetical protein
MAEPIVIEAWRPINWIEGVEGYEVSNLGQVRSLDRIVDCGRAGMRPVKGRILKQNKTQGYWKTDLGKGNTWLVHILVCTAFHGPKPSPEHEVAHWDGNKENNVWTNLRWTTPVGNKADHIRHGRHPRGETSHFAKISEEDVMEIRRSHRDGTASIELEKKYELSHSHIWQIVTGKAWAHLPFDEGGGRAEVAATALFTPEQLAGPEFWLPIAEHPGYEASSYGRVRSLDRIITRANGAPQTWEGRVLAQHIHKATNRLQVSLTSGIKCLVHVIICTTFNGPKPTAGHDVAYRDGDLNNVRADNLFWQLRVTGLRNDYRKHGAYRSAKLEEKDVVEIRRLYADGVGMLRISEQFDVTRMNVWNICLRRTWQHVK